SCSRSSPRSTGASRRTSCWRPSASRPTARATTSCASTGRRGTPEATSSRRGGAGCTTASCPARRSRRRPSCRRRSSRRPRGRAGTGTGFDAYALRFADGLGFTAGLEVHPTGERHPLAATQHHHRMEGRDIVRATTLERYLHEKPERPELEATLYPLVPYPGH